MSPADKATLQALHARLYPTNSRYSLKEATRTFLSQRQIIFGSPLWEPALKINGYHRRRFVSANDPACLSINECDEASRRVFT